MSGGVDSSVSAALLKAEGLDIVGVFIKVWQPDFLPCPWREERLDAMRAAAHLRIPFITLDFSDTYKREVVDYMIREYEQGRTPNPDVMCNKEIKFGMFLREALARGADMIATGHYAQITRDASGSFHLLAGKDKKKDQSYFLWTLGQHELRHALFPVGGYTKPQVRALAKKFGLLNAAKKDSQGLCFIGKLDMNDFLKHYITPRRGNVFDTHGKKIGTHNGVVFYTIGERHGFTIHHARSHDRPLYVISKDLRHNTITVGDEIMRRKTAPQTAILEQEHWVSGTSPKVDKEYHTRTRYREDLATCTVQTTPETRVIFDRPHDALTPGQSLVLYKNKELLGGGIIRRAES